MLSLRDLRHEYDGRRVLEIAALDLPPGLATALVGPNGSGKSTLLRILSFVEAPSQGTVSLDGRPVLGAAARRAARKLVTLVEQRPFLFRGTVDQNLTYALRLHGVRGAAAARRARAALEQVGIGSLGERDARRLSEGEVQLVAVARALALEPRVLLLDEPVSAADRAASALLYRVIEAETARKAVVCFASHQLEDAYRWSDRLVALADGRASAITPENLFRTVLPSGDGTKVVRAGPLEIQVVTDRSGPASIAIPAGDIIVSPAPLHSSARNTFAGRVTRVGEDGHGGVTLAVDVGVDFTVRITHRSLRELGITLGSEVVLSFKAMAVRVF